MADIPVKVTIVNLQTLQRKNITGWGDTGPLISTWLGTIDRRTMRFIQRAYNNEHVVVLNVSP